MLRLRGGTAFYLLPGSISEFGNSTLINEHSGGTPLVNLKIFSTKPQSKWLWMAKP
jgi:hypothetical protein